MCKYSDAFCVKKVKMHKDTLLVCCGLCREVVSKLTKHSWIDRTKEVQLRKSIMHKDHGETASFLDSGRAWYSEYMIPPDLDGN